jgi:uncharacterized protein YecT (DUF1311 family)
MAQDRLTSPELGAKPCSVHWRSKMVSVRETFLQALLFRRLPAAVATIGKFLLAGPVLALGVQSANAQESPEFQACMDRAAGVSTEMLDCGKTQIDRWNKRLNAAYEALMRKGTRAEQTRLRREQRAWLQHHLAQTHHLAVDPNNGSVAFLDSQAFELTDLRARVLTLENRIQQAR